MKPSSSSNHTSETAAANKSSSTNRTKRQNSKSKFKKTSQSSSSQQNTSCSSSSSSSNANATAGTPAGSAPTPIDINISVKEKTSHKSYAGFDWKSLKSIWEQSDSTAVNTDALQHLATDTTYRLWELANNLKTYSRHSGGRVTVDLVNEVLKDSDVPPTIGAGSTYWDKIECKEDGTYFFHYDEIHELRNEYSREINTTQCGPIALASTWTTHDKESEKYLINLNITLCNAIFLGNEAAFKYAIHTTLINPFIGCIINLSLSKCAEMIALDYTDDILDRFRKFLLAIVYNSYTRDVQIKDKLYHLCHLLICVLLGPAQDCMSAEEKMAEELKSLDEQRIRQREDEINSIAKELQNTKQDLPAATYYSTVDDVDIQICEALLQKMENEGFDGTTTGNMIVNPAADNLQLNNIKEELYADVTGPITVAETQSGHNFIAYANLQDDGREIKPLETYTDFKLFDGSGSIKNEPSYYDDDVQFKIPLAATLKTYGKQQQPEMSPPPISMNPFKDDGEEDEKTHYICPTITSKMCADQQVDDMCTLIGLMAAKWGYFESESIFILSHRLEQYFANQIKIVKIDYPWLSRMVRLLFALGDHAFRELTIYFDQIDTIKAPDWIQKYFNAAAIYVRGRKDIFFYEYLYDLCGDSLMPFMIYYSNYRRKLSKKHRPSTSTYSISPKLSIKLIDRNSTAFVRYSLEELFPDLQHCKQQRPKIGFKFAGSCPVQLSSKSKSFTDSSKSMPPNQLFPKELCPTKIIIGRHKLLKTICDGKKCPKVLSDFGCLRI